MQQRFECNDCRMVFDNANSLQNHQQKFCTGSKYADLDTLTHQYSKLQQQRQPPKINLSPNLKASQNPLNKSTSQAYQNNTNNDIDREYRQLLRQIGDKQDLRKKLEREKQTAEQQLATLQKKENELFVNARKKELDQLIRKREQMAKEEDQIQKQIRNFQKEQKQESRLRQVKADQDFVFREGREAGKLAMQRRILEEKKKDLELNLKQKRREQQRIHLELEDINDRPVFIPDYKKPQTVPQKKTYTEPVPKEFSSPAQSRIKQTNIKPPSRRQPQQQQQQPSKVYPVRNVKESIVHNGNSKVSMKSEVDENYLKAALFSGQQKTLFESLNPKNKSDEDIFIESLVAQEYDALNLLARLPKDSELYAIKLKQFQQMSKLRHQMKDKVQKVRLEKVRRQFQMEKQMTQTEKNNLIWLDRNRRQMLNREVDILRNNQRPPQEYQQEPQYIPNVSLPTQSPAIRQQPNSNTGKKKTNISDPSKFPSIQNIPYRRQQFSQQGRKVYKIIVRSVRNYVSKSPMCIKLVVMQEGSDNPKWSFSTKYHEQSAPKDDRNPYNPTIRNRSDESGAINFNQVLQIGEDLQNYYNNYQNQLYLWILMMEKDDLKLSNQPDISLWYCLKLTHFGTIREGVFTFNLYHDNCPFPEPRNMNQFKGKAAQQVIIQLTEQVISVQPKPPRTVTKNQRRTGGLEEDRNGSATSAGREANRQRGRAVRPQPSQAKINSLKNIKEQFYIENEQVSNFQTVKAEEPTSFDLCISALRTLPSHIGPLKLQISFFDCQGDQVLDTDQILAQFGEDMYNPRVNYTKKIRKKEIPSSTVILIKIIALSTINYEPGLLGCCYVHLGFDQNGRMMESNQKEYLMLNGHFQLPIFWGNISSYLNMEQIHGKYPSIPCSSLLLSVGEPGMGLPPFYQEGVYNTTFFQVDELEYRLFQEQIKREKLRTLDFVNGYYKFKGVDVNKYKTQELQKLLGQALAFNSENISNLLRLEALAEYNSSFGIQMNIDGLIVPPQQTNYYYFATVCPHPPAGYYTSNQVDLEFIYKVDLPSSLTSHLIFEENALKYFPEYSPSTAVIIELNRVKISQNGSPGSSIETVANIVLPLFDLEKEMPCVDVGTKEIRLIEGQFDKADLKSLQGNAIRYFQIMQGKKRSDFSLVLRMMNGYFNTQLGGQRKGQKGKPLRSIFQNSKGFKDAQSTIIKIIQETYGIQFE